jgi:hypothetical protein
MWSISETISRRLLEKCDVTRLRIDFALPT